MPAPAFSFDRWGCTSCSNASCRLYCACGGGTLARFNLPLGLNRGYALDLGRGLRMGAELELTPLAIREPIRGEPGEAGWVSPDAEAWERFVA